MTMTAEPSGPPSVPPSGRPAARRRPRQFASLRCIGALMLREMATTYGRSPGGYVWVLLEPIAGIALLTFAFSFLFHSPPIGVSFELFYATGMLPFVFFTTVCNRVGGAITFSRPLLLYPAVTFVDAIIARFAVNILTEFLVFSIIITGILTMFDTRAVLDLRYIGLSLFLAGTFALGVGCLNAYLFLRFHIWQVFWSVISRPLFLISGAMFTYDHLPAQVQGVLWYNPLMHAVGTMRAGFYPSYDASYTSPLYVICVSLILMVTGLVLLKWQIKYLLYEV
ncbi:ABC transporter permease [Xinfangfangia pollutisoli]|uniref:ABC transporter permease n=1 Tax=Xinfangfangia pollutisoli TaxID=2865960 RepID=UPI001CD7E6C4|nr:ABC transporter permease [Xinfangfangia pollutisoli]